MTELQEMTTGKCTATMGPHSEAMGREKMEQNFDERIREAIGGSLEAASIETIQINIGLTCNQACHHCHVTSSPQRKEQMSRETLLHVLDAGERAGARVIDITGGAPEMNPHFRWFVAEARKRGFEVMVRTNLTILLVEGYTDIPEFYRRLRVHLVASLPCYLEQNVDRQRGKNAYAGSIEALRRLNELGYGTRPELALDLVYNPLGPHLPPGQVKLEEDYRRELKKRFGISFTRLLCITNMAIGRFLHDLERDGKADGYQQLLRESFNSETIGSLMCRRMLHVSWDGTIHDCDFNYALSMPCNHGLPRHIKNFDPELFSRRTITTGEHCFGCTAGCGSSCGGALAG